MLDFLLAADLKAASDALFDRMLERIGMGEGDQILIVPEQISFESERKLCRLGGDSVCRFAEVLSFSRLADRVASEYGGVALRYLDKGGRLLAAAQAVEQVHSRIKLFASVCRKPEFLEAFLQAVEEFGNYGLTADSLREAASRETGQFAQKLEELSLLLESYAAVTAQAQDPVCRMQRLRDTLTAEDYAVGKSFYIFGFTDFTRLEQAVVEQLIRSADRVVVALAQETAEGAEVFSAAQETYLALRNYANANGVQTRRQTVAFSDTPEDLVFVQKQIVRTKPQQYSSEIYSARCIRAADRDGECRAAIREIRKLLASGARLREIAIACQDEQTLPLLESMLSSSELPYFISRKQPLPEHSGARMVLCAVRAAAMGFEREDVVDYVKSGAAGIPDDACDRLENYAIIWNISGSRWEKEWTFHPRGLVSDWYDRDYAALKKLNALREKAIAPLSGLKTGLSDAETVGQMAQAVYAFLQQIGFADTMQTAAESFYARGDVLRAQQYAQICEILLGALEQTDLILHDCVRTPDAYCSLFEKLLACYSVGAIPAAADQITVGTAQDFRAREVAHFLILDADDGHFPAAIHHSGVLSETERTRLIAAGMPMAPSDFDAMERELSGVYLSIRAARKTLSLFYAGDTPSFVTRRFAAITGTQTQEDTLLPLTVEEAASMYLQYGSDPRGESVSEAAERLGEKCAYTFGTIDRERTDALYGSEIRLSATKIDTFSKCRFAFFMKYGLKADPREAADFNATQFGSFLHKVLEDTARAVMERGGFRVVPLDTVRALANEAMDKYREENLQGLSDQARFAEMFRRNRAEALSVVDDLVKELSQSDFEPFAFELKFSDHDGVMQSIHEAGDTASCTVTGSVDRVDLYADGDKTYARVIDYKTGSKDFDYADLTFGIGLQMLIYLFAIRKFSKETFGEQYNPAGVLYMPARRDFSNETTRPTEQQAKKSSAELRRRKGLILSDEKIERAMEHFDTSPQYLPLKEKKGVLEGDVATREEFGRLERFVFFKLRGIADAIASGTVTPNPTVRSEQDSACTYCDYADVCGKDLAQHEQRPIRKIERGDFFAYLAQWEDTNG